MHVSSAGGPCGHGERLAERGFVPTGIIFLRGRRAGVPLILMGTLCGVWSAGDARKCLHSEYQKSSTKLVLVFERGSTRAKQGSGIESQGPKENLDVPGSLGGIDGLV